MSSAVVRPEIVKLSDGIQRLPTRDEAWRRVANVFADGGIRSAFTRRDRVARRCRCGSRGPKISGASTGTMARTDAAERHNTGLHRHSPGTDQRRKALRSWSCWAHRFPMIGAHKVMPAYSALATQLVDRPV